MRACCGYTFLARSGSPVRFLLLTLLLLTLCRFSFGQTYNISAYNGQTVTTCSGTFYDSGGLLGDYSNNENYTVTFCSGNGNAVRFDFTQLTIRSGDTLYIHDGPDLASPLKAKYSNTNLPVSMISSGTCMTFRFASNGIFTRPGWVANVSCCSPPVTSAIQPSDPYQCAGSVINYSVDFHAGSVYNWSVTNGSPSSVTAGTNNLTVTWDPNGDITGYVKVVEVNSCGSKDSSQLAVDIYSLPVVSFSGLNAYYCIYSAPSVLTGSPAGGTFSGPGIAGSTFDPAAAGGGTHSITYTYTDPVTLCVNQKIIQTIVSTPQLFVVGASASSYCTGSGVSITLSGSEAGIDYQLLKNGLNDGSSVPGTGSSLTWTNRQAGVYTIVATNGISTCSATMTGSQTITENPLPVPSIIAAPGPATCSSVNVTYSTQAGQSNYIWGFSGSAGTDYILSSGGTAADNTVILSWLTAGSKTVTVNYTDPNGCTATTPVSSSPTVVTLSPPPPTGSATQDFCTGASPSVANLSATGTAVKWYAAATGGTALLSSTLLADNTHYYASQTIGGCESINRLDVIANLIPVPSAPIAGAGTVAACTQITANWAAASDATSYRLDVSSDIGFSGFISGYNDLNTGNVTSLTVSGLTAGVTYYYRVRAVNLCGTSANSNIITYSTLPAAPATPGAIAGQAVQCSAQTGQVYSVTDVPNATLYTWSVPAGWTITGGLGTKSVTVTTGAPGQNGNISVTASNTCGASAPSTLAVTVLPNAAITSVTGGSPVCIGAITTYTANGVVTGGGTGTWSSSDNTIATVDAAGSVTAVKAGTCNIIYTITGGCGGTVSAQKPITVNPDAAVASVTGTAAICIGGTATYSASGVVTGGGTGSWSSSNTAVATVSAAGLVTGVAAGTCNIIYTITGGCGLPASAHQAIIVYPSASISSVTGTSPLCIAGVTSFTANGVVLSGGTGTWSSSNPAVATVDATGSVTGVTAGSCNIIYTITGGCGGTVSAQRTLTVNPNASIISVTGASPLCTSATSTFTANGIVLSGGTGTWSSSNPAIATVNATGLVTGVTAGTCNIIYTITGGCGGTVSQQRSVTITPLASVGSVSGSSPLCISNSVQYNANAVVTGGGTGAWSSSNPGVATVNATGLVTGISAGTCNIIYTITGGCGGTVSAQQTITIRPNSAVSAVSGVSPLCIGGTATYSATGVILSGGTATWSSSNTAIATVSPVGLVTAIAPGTCNIIFTITGGCGGTVSAQRTVTVNQNAAVASVTGTSPLCINGTTTFTANGVVTGGGTGNWSTSNPAVATVSAAGLVRGVAAGTCNIIYTISGGCGGTVSALASVTINANAAVASVTGTASLCLGASATYTANGVVLSGGTGAWSSSNLSVATVSAAGLVSSVAPGTSIITYTVTGGCGGTASASRTVTVNANAAITTVSGSSPLCIGGTATFTALGVVLGGGTGTWSSSNPAFATVNAAGLVTGIAAGTCDITYTITGGCGGVVSGSRTVTVVAPPASTISYSGLPWCGTSGTKAVTLTGTTGGTFSAVPAGLSINATDGTIDPSLSAAGIYTVSYTMTSVSCGSIISTTSVTILPIPALVIHDPAPVCSPSLVNLTAPAVTSGSTGVLTLSYWTDALATIPYGTPVAALSGTYYIKGTDAAGCFDIKSVHATINPLPVLSGAATDIACHGQSTGSVDITLSGGTAPYTYAWSGTGISAGAEDQTSLGAGVYTVIVTDAAGCSTPFTQFTITEPPVLSGTVTSQTNVTLFGGNDGSVTASGSGGVAPYTFSIDGGTAQASGTFGSLIAGTHNIAITDNHLCVFDLQVVITQPAPPFDASVDSLKNVTCFGGSDGLVSLSAAGGAPPFSYRINGGSWQPTGMFLNLTAGSYTVTVRDAALSIVDVPVDISQPSEPVTAFPTVTDIVCTGSATGAIDMVVSGGTAPYSFLWTTGAITKDISGLVAGDYGITVTDSVGCVLTQSVTVAQVAEALSVTLDYQENVTCAGLEDGSVTVVATGGTEPYQFSVNGIDFQPSGTFSSLSPGGHTITVMDASLCTAVTQVTISEPSHLVINGTTTDVSCPGDFTGEITISVSGGTSPYSVLWDDGTTTLVKHNLTNKTYNVVAADTNGCATSAVFEIGVTGGEECLIIPTIITPNADGYNDTWVIGNIELFPKSEVFVYNRWGELVFHSRNLLADHWEGTSHRKLLPTDSYHYVLKLGNGTTRSGVISIIR